MVTSDREIIAADAVLNVDDDALFHEGWMHIVFPGEALRGGPHLRVQVEEPAGEALEQVGLVGADAQVLELDLGLGPGQPRRPLEGRRPEAVGPGDLHELGHLLEDPGELLVDRSHGEDEGRKAE